MRQINVSPYIFTGNFDELVRRFAMPEDHFEELVQQVVQPEAHFGCRALHIGDSNNTLAL